MGEPAARHVKCVAVWCATSCSAPASFGDALYPEAQTLSCAEVWSEVLPLFSPWLMCHVKQRLDPVAVPSKDTCRGDFELVIHNAWMVHWVLVCYMWA